MRHVSAAGPKSLSYLAVAAFLLATSVGGHEELVAQQTFIVSSTGDGADADPGDGSCDDGSGACTLRGAIEEANALAGVDRIHFAVPGSGPHAIIPSGALAPISEPVVIDGYTQPGASPNTNSPDMGTNANLRVVLDANAAGGFGLEIIGGGTTVRGLRVINANSRAISIVSGGGNVIEGNELVPGPSAFGVFIESSGANLIGGTTPAARNVVGGGSDGIQILGGAANVIQGNLIGVGPDGVSALPEQNDAGIRVHAPDTQVGGAAPGAGNVLSGNIVGVFVGHSSAGTVVQGNRIGTTAAGTAALANFNGVVLTGATAAIVGGSGQGEGNTISGNTDVGIVVESEGNRIEGNYIGTDASGTIDLGNGAEGIRVTASTNLILQNVIAFNQGEGVQVSNGTGVTVSENSIYSNSKLGIDLRGDGVSPNDAGDVDGLGLPNDMQNFPRVMLAYDGGARVEGFLEGAPGQTVTIEIFSSPVCDPSDHGEGRAFLGSAIVTNDVGGQGAFTVPLGTPAAAGDVLAATTTDGGGNTSEFSRCFRVGSQATLFVTASDDAEDGVCSEGHCSLREAIVWANAFPSPVNVHFDIPGAGPHTIVPGTSLPRIGSSIVIDGYTQSGAGPNTNPREAASNAVLMVELDATGHSFGLELEGSGATVRGLRIEGAGDAGIEVLTGGGNVIEGNDIRSGASAWNVSLLAPDNLVGGTTAMARNVLGGALVGVHVNADGNMIQGNLIGLDGAGSSGLGNDIGVRVVGGSAAVGGDVPGAGNVISGNSIGVLLEGGAGTVVRGNFIGTDVTGELAIPNDAMGVHVNGASDASIGGATAGAGNTIAFNGGAGVGVETGSGISILGNSIGSNVGLGIDLGLDGVTLNDTGDGDDGPNTLLNQPTVSYAIAGSALITGTLSAGASTSYLLELFGGAECDSSGHGEGERFLASTMVSTDAGGDATFEVASLSALTPGDHVTATATDGQGSTSEFSACVTAVGFELALAPPDVEVLPGASAQYAVTVSSVAGALDRDVVLSCQGLPAGAACAFSPSSVQPGATFASSALTLTTTTSAPPPGSSEFTVSGSIEAIERTALATIAVADFSLAISPPSRTIARSDAATYTVSVEPTGGSFPAEVALSCSGLPAGATCVFSPPALTPGTGSASATLTLSTAAQTVSGGGRSGPPTSPPAFVWLLGLGALAAAMLMRDRRPSAVARAWAFGWLLLVAGTLSCSGDATQPPDPVTTSFTVTATWNTVSHSATASVTVQ